MYVTATLRSSCAIALTLIVVSKGFAGELASQALLPSKNTNEQAHSLGLAVGTYGEWAVHVQEDLERCTITSEPQSVVATRNGHEVTLQRPNVFLTVTRDPSGGTYNAVSFNAGWPIGSSPRLTVGPHEFRLQYEGILAVATTSEVNANIVEQLRLGRIATMVTVTSRDTVLTDVFSLDGFEDALAIIEEQCAS